MVMTPGALGRFGEAAAARFLGRKGFLILARNWTCGRVEVDLVARHGQRLVFVEVKTRRGCGLQAPEMAVDAAKQERLRRAGRLFKASFPLLPHDSIRFDVVAVSVTRNDRIREVRHFEDAF